MHKVSTLLAQCKLINTSAASYALDAVEVVWGSEEERMERLLQQGVMEYNEKTEVLRFSSIDPQAVSAAEAKAEQAQVGSGVLTMTLTTSILLTASLL